MVNFICIWIGLIIFNILFIYFFFVFNCDIFGVFMNVILNLVIEYDNSIQNYMIIFKVLNVFVD